MTAQRPLAMFLYGCKAPSPRQGPAGEPIIHTQFFR